MNMFRLSALNEASFGVKDLQKVAEAYGALFGKEFGGKFYPLAIEWYKKQKEKGQGVRMINDAGAMLRINFSNRTSNFANAPKEFVVLSSIDYWAPGNSNDTQPTTSCYFDRAVNVVKIWKTLGSLIRNGRSGKYTIGDLTGLKESDVNEAINLRSGKERLAFYKEKGLPSSAVRSKEAFAEYIETNNLEDAWNEFVVEIEPGKPEQNALASEVKKNEKALEDHPYCDPDTIFEDIELLTLQVVSKITRSFVLCGMGGLGKTYHVTKMLGETLGSKGRDWQYIAGKEFTPSTFYDELFRVRDYITVFDEADSILTSPECIVMLKPMLDTSGDNTMEYASGKMPCFKMTDNEIRRYCEYVDELIDQGVPIYKGTKGPAMWSGDEDKNGNKKFGLWNKVTFMTMMKDGELSGDDITGYWVPSKFFFNGGLIFISNLPAKKLDQAILSRSAFIDLWLTATDIKKRIRYILSQQYGESALLDEVIEFLGSDSRTKQLTVRSGTYAMKMAMSDNPVIAKNWRRLINHF